MATAVPAAGIATVTVHAKAHAEAAAEAAVAANAPIRVLSAPGASAYLGPAWFRHAVADARVLARRHGVAFEAYLDCAERAGDAMAAVREGVPGIVVTVGDAVAAKLAAMAAARDIAMLAERPASLDLDGVTDAAGACRDALGAR